MASALLLALFSFPGTWWLAHPRHAGSNAHPVATTIAIAAVLVFVGWAFRRKPV